MGRRSGDAPLQMVDVSDGRSALMVNCDWGTLAKNTVAASFRTSFSLFFNFIFAIS